MTRTHAVCLTSLVAVGGCHSGTTREAKAEPSPLGVRVVTIGAVVANTKDLVGVTEPARRAALGTRLSARVVEVRANEGDRVEKGAVLVRLGTQDLAARRAEASASLASADAQRENAATDLQRQTRLAASGAVAKKSADDAKEKALTNRANTEQARASVQEIDAMLGDAVIVAPFAGRVVMKQTEVGSFSTPGQALMTIEDDSQLRVTAAVGAVDAAGLSPRASFPVTLAGGAVVESTLDSVLSSGDATTVGLRAVFVIANPDHRWSAGTAATVHIEATRDQATEMRIPATAVVRRGSLAGAYVVTDSRAHLVFCGLEGVEPGGALRVIDGVRVGDRVVENASQGELFDGRPVTVTP